VEGDKNKIATGGRVSLARDVLLNLRRNKGLSQELVALMCAEQRLCVSIASIKRAELGKNILFRTARDIAQFFDVGLDTLIASNDDLVVATTPQNNQISIASKRDIVVLLCELTHADDDLLSNIENDWQLSCESAAEFSCKYFPLSENRAVFLFGGEALMGYEHFQALQSVTRLHQRMRSQYAEQGAIHSFICYHEIRSQDETVIYPDEKAIRDMTTSVGMDDVWKKYSTTYLVLVSEQVKQGLETKFSTHVFAVENKQHNLWRVDVSKTVSSESKLIIGRDLQCRQFEAAVESVYAYNEMQLVYISGMAGIGKTCLQEEFCDYASNLGIECHRTHVLDFGAEQNQTAIPKLIRSILRLSADDINLSFEELNKRFGREVCEQQDLLFLYSWLDWSLTGKALSIFHTMSHEVRSTGLNKVVGNLIRNCTQKSPLLLCIEDMHWANDDLLDSISQFVAALKDYPVLLLLTSRKENDPLQKKWSSAWADLPMLVMNLAPLRQAEANQLAESFTDVSDEYKQLCIARAEGNPLFLEQLLRESHLQLDSLPHTVQTLVSVRLESLPATYQSAARAASVLGQWFTLDALNFVLQVKDFDIQPLVEHYLVKPVGDRFQFVHALVQQGVYQTIMDEACVELHQRCASWFETIDVSLQARHLNRARVESVFKVYIQAINKKIESQNFDEANVLVDEALVIDYAEIDEYVLWCLKGDIMEARGMTVQAVECYQNALQKTQSDGQKFIPLVGLATGLDTLEKYDEALAALATAEKCLSPESRDSQLSQIHYLRGNFYFPKGQVDACWQEHDKALEYARLAKDSNAEAKAFGGLGDAAYAQGKMVTAFDYFKQCLSLCSSNAFGKVEAANLFMLATTSIYLNETRQALQDALSSAELASSVGHKRAEIVSRLTASWILLSMQTLEPARQQIEKGLVLVEAIGAFRFKPFLYEALARYHYANGDQAMALSTITEAWDDVQAQGIEEFIGPWVISTYAVINPDEKQAMALLATGSEWLEKGCIGHNYFRYYASAIESCLLRSDWPALKKYIIEFKAYTKDEPTPWSNYKIARAELIAEAQQTINNSDRGDLVSRLQALELKAEAADFNHSLVAIKQAITQLQS